MAKKDFTQNLRGRSRIASLIPGGMEETEEQEATMRGEAEEVSMKSKPTQKKAPPATNIGEGATNEAANEPNLAETPAPPRTKRSRKKPDKQPVTFRLEEDLVFDLKAAAFWDRRDFTEIVTMGLKHYLSSWDESDLRRARREFKKRLEESGDEL